MATGYDCDFVEPPPDALLCLICTFVAKEPMQMDCCGRVYCKACLNEHKKLSNKCPQCREDGNGFNDRRGEREVKALKVKCNNNGCVWMGEIATLHQHNETCEHAFLSCPNECKESAEPMSRKDLESHLKDKCPNRNYECPYCKEEGKHHDITTSHLETCPQLVIACPNEDCDENVPRCDIPSHLKECPFETVPCKYIKIGCEEKGLRKELEDHDQQHLHLAMETILKQGDILTHAKDMKFKMSKFSKYKGSKKSFDSPPFYTNHGGYKMCLRIYANGWGAGEGTHVSVHSFLMKGENDDSLSWPFTGTVTVELLNQLEDKHHHQRTIRYPEGKEDKGNKRVVDGVMQSEGWGHPKFISHEALNHNPGTNCQYLKDDCLYFRVSVKADNIKPWLTTAM